MSASSSRARPWGVSAPEPGLVSMGVGARPLGVVQGYLAQKKPTHIQSASSSCARPGGVSYVCSTVALMRLLATEGIQIRL